MADASAAAGPKPSSSVKLVLLGEAAVGKVRGIRRQFDASKEALYMTFIIKTHETLYTDGHHQIAVVPRPPFR